MPIIAGFAAADNLKVEAAFKKCLRIVEDVEKRFDELKARRAFDTIMGGSQRVDVQTRKAAETLLKQTLTAILLRMRTPIFEIVCDTAGVLNGMYASMDAIAPQHLLNATSFAKEDTFGNVTPGHWDIREVASVTDQMRSGYVGTRSSTLVNGVSVVPAILPLRLNPIVCGFPEFALHGPSLTGTLIHELSHLSAATIDDDADGNCYEWPGVQLLASKGPGRAVRNAENVAYFCLHATYVC
jgi:hypothetical protein